MKIFISGPITKAQVESDRAKFEIAENYLKEMNHLPINPFKINFYCLAPWPLRLESLTGCEAIFMLSDWQTSSEAMMEKYYSSITGKEILYQSRTEIDKETKYLVSEIDQAIEEVTGMRLKEYRDGPRSGCRYFARMLFSFHCNKSGIDPSVIINYIDRDVTSILRYLKKYDDEFKFNPAFRSMAERVNQKLNSEVPNL